MPQMVEKCWKYQILQIVKQIVDRLESERDLPRAEKRLMVKKMATEFGKWGQLMVRLGFVQIPNLLKKNLTQFDFHIPYVG